MYGLLPHTGLLYFFFDIALYFTSLTSLYRKVLYFDGPSAHLKRTSIPHPAPVPDEEIIMPSCAVEFSCEIMLPPFDSLYTRHLPLEEDPFDLLEEVEHFYDENHRSALHRMLGHPNALQDDMQVVGQQRWLQKQDEAVKKKTTEGEAKKWLLLLQIGNDDNLKRDWGNSGKLYYWIRPEDLTAHYFDHVEFIHQSY